jgi:hypothetical protein
VTPPTALGVLPALPPDAVLLHIGVHKTGTTAIQAALADAREQLLAHQVLYPGRLQAQHRAALAALGRTWGWNQRGGAVVPTRHLEAIAKEVAGFSGRAVISSEFFCEADAETAQRVVAMLGGKRVHIVVTLRNLGSLLPSSWQQYLKYGLESDYEPWLRDVFAEPGSSRKSPTFWRRHDHGAVVQRWADAAGSDQLTVLVLEEVDRAALFVAFAQLLGIPEDLLTSRMDLTSNRSMTAAEAELLLGVNRRVKRELQWPDYVRLVRRGMALAMVEKRQPNPTEPRVITPDWALDAAAQQGELVVAQIAAAGVRVAGPLPALAVRLPSPKSAVPAESPGAMQLPVAAALEAVAAVVTESAQQTSSRALARQLLRQIRNDLRDRLRPRAKS